MISEIGDCATRLSSYREYAYNLSRIQSYRMGNITNKQRLMGLKVYVEDWLLQ